jgi:hypothetical protein
MSYGGNGTTISLPAPTRPSKPASAPAVSSNGETDFSKMTPAQKIAYHKARWDRILG